MAITILITDRNLQPVGDPIWCWETVDVTAKFNEVGTGMFTAPAWPWVREQIQPGNRVVVIRDGRIFLAGPIERRLTDQSDDGENSGTGKITVHFSDDLLWIAGKVTYPNPAQAIDAQTVDYWTYAGNGELAMRQLVNLNAGPGALTERRVPKLVLGALAGVGSTVDVSTRVEPLGEVLRRTALAAGGLGFRTRQVGTDIHFEVYQPQDRSASVRFGFDLGNMRNLAYETVAPTATTAIVGGQGEGADRLFISRTDSTDETAWGRLETVVSRAGTDPLEELQAAGDEQLAEAGESIRMQTSTYDSPDQRYPEHYDLGTRVTVALGDGQEISDLVRLVHLQAWATAGELVSAMVGTQEATQDTQTIAKLRAIDRRLGRLERSTLPAS